MYYGKGKEENRIRAKSVSLKPVDTKSLKRQLEKARLKFKPQKIKYLLIAEAPPESIDRFFYYEAVRQHDYLFLGISEALYPEMKNSFLENRRSSAIKHSILQ